VSEERRKVALTFDAEHPSRPHCPPGNAERILDALAEAGVRATFFLQGTWASAYPAAAARIAAEGHLVGNHSHAHAHMPLLSPKGIRVDVRAAGELIRETTGADPRPWFRCPYGDGHGDAAVLAALEELGYRDVGWDVDLEDWKPSRSAADLRLDALAAVRAHGEEAVLLLHSWPAATADALPDLLRGLLEAGARFVGLDQLERIP
jgi:peptidoglycan-N-acetylglucosamine deacetylase